VDKGCVDDSDALVDEGATEKCCMGKSIDECAKKQVGLRDQRVGHCSLRCRRTHKQRAKNRSVKMMLGEKCARLHENVEKKCVDFVKRVGSRRSRRSRRGRRSELSSRNNICRHSSSFSSRPCGTMGRNTPSILQKDLNARWCQLDAKEESIPESRREAAGPEWHRERTTSTSRPWTSRRSASSRSVCSTSTCSVAKDLNVQWIEKASLLTPVLVRPMATVQADEARRHRHVGDRGHRAHASVDQRDVDDESLERSRGAVRRMTWTA